MAYIAYVPAGSTGRGRFSARSGITGQPMHAVVAKLKIVDMIDIAAYVASLPS